MRELRVGVAVFLINIGLIMLMIKLGVSTDTRAIIILGVTGCSYPLLRQLDICITEK